MQMTQKIIFAGILSVLTLIAVPATAMTDASCSSTTQAMVTSAPKCSSSQAQPDQRTQYAQIPFCRRAAFQCAYYCTHYERGERYCMYHCMRRWGCQGW